MVTQNHFVMPATDLEKFRFQRVSLLPLKTVTLYRVVHLVGDHILMTLKYELHFTIRSLYCSGTFNLMSTNCVPQPKGPPCPHQRQLLVVSILRQSKAPKL